MLLDAKTAQSEDDFGGNARPLPGRYHAAINHAEEKSSKKKGTPGLDLEFVVVADGLASDGKSQTVGQAKRTIPLFLSYVGGDDSKTQTCINRVTRLALCVGVLSPGEAKEPDWQDAIGRELVIEIEEQEYQDQQGNDKKGSQVSFLGFWSLGNAQVANVPKDTTTPGMQQLAKAGGPVNHPAPTAPTSTASVQSTTKARGKFANL